MLPRSVVIRATPWTGTLAPGLAPARSALTSPAPGKSTSATAPGAARFAQPDQAHSHTPPKLGSITYRYGHAALLFGGDKISLLGLGVNQFRPSDGSFLWGERWGFRADAGVHRTLGSVLIVSALLLQTPSGGQD